MSSYHFSMSIVKRSAGQSAVAAAAYRAGQRLHDRETGITHDYARRRGVAHTEILLPNGAPDWMNDREVLWNHASLMERRKDAQLAREFNAALPASLSAEERLDLVRGFVREEFVARGMVADIALHDPVPEKGDDPRNFHCHVLLTLRQAGPEGLRATKTREWNSDDLLKAWRLSWADYQNRALERAGRRERVDARRLDVQRAEAERAGDRTASIALDRVPEIHMGRRARSIEKRGARPQSRNRDNITARPGKGSFRSSPERARRQRSIAYERIDDGTRSEWNGRILEENERRSRARFDKLERQAVRVRQRHLRSLKMASMPLIRTAMGQDQRRAIAKRHAARSWSLLQQIERLMADLLNVRTKRQRRHRDLLRLRDVRLGKSRRRT